MSSSPTSPAPNSGQADSAPAEVRTPTGRGAGASGPPRDPAEGDRPPDLPASQADQRQGLTQRKGPDHDEREDVDIAAPRR